MPFVGKFARAATTPRIFTPHKQAWISSISWQYRLPLHVCSSCHRCYCCSCLQYTTQDKAHSAPILKAITRQRRGCPTNETVHFRKATDQTASTPPYSALKLFLLLKNRASRNRSREYIFLCRIRYCWPSLLLRGAVCLLICITAATVKGRTDVCRC